MRSGAERNSVYRNGVDNKLYNLISLREFRRHSSQQLVSGSSLKWFMWLKALKLASSPSLRGLCALSLVSTAAYVHELLISRVTTQSVVLYNVSFYLLCCFCTVLHALPVDQ